MTIALSKSSQMFLSWRIPIKYCIGGTTHRLDWPGLYQLTLLSAFGGVHKKGQWHIFGGHAQGHAGYRSESIPFFAIYFMLTSKGIPMKPY